MCSGDTCATRLWSWCLWLWGWGWVLGSNNVFQIWHLSARAAFLWVTGLRKRVLPSARSHEEQSEAAEAKSVIPEDLALAPSASLGLQSRRPCRMPWEGDRLVAPSKVTVEFACCIPFLQSFKMMYS